MTGKFWLCNIIFWLTTEILKKLVFANFDFIALIGQSNPSTIFKSPYQIIYVGQKLALSLPSMPDFWNLSAMSPKSINNTVNATPAVLQKKKTTKFGDVYVIFWPLLNQITSQLPLSLTLFATGKVFLQEESFMIFYACTQISYFLFFLFFPNVSKKISMRLEILFKDWLGINFPVIFPLKF